MITIEDGSIHLYKDAPEGSNVVMGYISHREGIRGLSPASPVPVGGEEVPAAVGIEARRGAVLPHPRGRRRLAACAPVPDRADQRGRPDRPPRAPARYLDRPQDPLGQDAHVSGEQAGGRAVRARRSRAIAYQRHLAGEFERDDWNTAEIIARGTSTTHILNGQVVNRGENVRLVDPEHPGSPRPITRGRIALESRRPRSSSGTSRSGSWRIDPFGASEMIDDVINLSEATHLTEWAVALGKRIDQRYVTEGTYRIVGL